MKPTPANVFNALSGGRTPGEIFRRIREVSLITELSDLVGIDTRPDKPNHALASHLNERLSSYISGKSEVVEYDEVLDGTTTRQQNLLFHVGEGEEHVVVSGHLDTIPADSASFSIDGLGEKPHFLRTEMGEGLFGEGPALYGLGTNDMKNVFSVMIQVAKEHAYHTNPQRFFDENDWLSDVLSEEELTALDKFVSPDAFVDVLSNAKNKLTFAATGGEEKAAHQGLKYLLENDDVALADLWLIPEPSFGLAETHKGIGAVSVMNETVDEGLQSIDALYRAAEKEKLLTPFGIEDSKLGKPTFNVGIFEGTGSLTGEGLGINITGVPAHSSDPSQGASAIQYGARLYGSLKAIVNDVQAVAFNGGQGRNSVASSGHLVLQTNDRDEVAKKITDISKLLAIDFPRISLEITEPELNNPTPSRFQAEYRTVVGQDAAELQSRVREICEQAGVSARVTLDREAYAMEGRFNKLDPSIKDILLSLTGQDESKSVPFSTEGGTLTNASSTVIPLIFSTTHIRNAHQQANEYISVEQLRRQFEIYSGALNVALKGKIRASDESLYSRLEGVVKRIGVRDDEFRSHLAWYRDYSGPFALIRADTEEDAGELQGVLNDLVNVFNLSPVVITNTPLSNSFVQHIALGELTYGKVSNALRANQVPVIRPGEHAGEAAKTVMSWLDPLKYIWLSEEGGIKDREGNIHDMIRINDHVEGTPETYADFVGSLHRADFSGKSLPVLFEMYDHLTSSQDPVKRKGGSVQVVNAPSFYRELFTLKGQGTYVRQGCDYSQESGEIREEDGIASASFHEKQGVVYLSNLNVRSGFWRRFAAEDLLDYACGQSETVCLSVRDSEEASGWTRRLERHLRSQGEYAWRVPINDVQGREGELFVISKNPFKDRVISSLPMVVDEGRML